MNWTLIIVALITAIPPTIVALLSLQASRENKTAIKEVHFLINSRMTELLKVSKASSRAEGVLEGKGK